jgi:hypothetical protein
MDDDEQKYSAPKEKLVLKFVILGDSNVGKTSILHYFQFGKCMLSLTFSQKNTATHCWS